MDTTSPIRLTQYSHGAGCGCKISPKVLESILASDDSPFTDPNLLVGNSTKDDAAVYDVGLGHALISTTDFFMPIVDDPFDFGQIASVNAISDVYAMGGKPTMAIAILGWPVDKIPIEAAQQVMAGARAACRKANIALAGGHSIDTPEPIFGLAVTGQILIEHLKRNDQATPGCKLFLTKPLGVGILTTAQKKGIVKEEDLQLAQDSMLKLNNAGMHFGRLSYVKAMTDVTGFGLLGHLGEMCEASQVSAVISADQVPRFDVIDGYIAQGSIPGGTQRNWDSYGDTVSSITEAQKALLCDPQTSGGLLVAVEGEYEHSFVQYVQSIGLSLQAFGEITERKDVLIEVN
ncbi:MAG: selenide, water dikinase SelD [Cyclobacteriaceae bacterium]